MINKNYKRKRLVEKKFGKTTWGKVKKKSLLKDLNPFRTNYKNPRKFRFLNYTNLKTLSFAHHILEFFRSQKFQIKWLASGRI
jgi:hypothetical protein